MGTNYYIVRNRPTIEEPIHIGKSSAGWFFLFQTQNKISHDPPIVWNTFEQVQDWLIKHTYEKKDYVIMDEYDRRIHCFEFLALVKDKQEDGFNKANPDNFKYCKNVNGYRFADGDFT